MLTEPMESEKVSGRSTLQMGTHIIEEEKKFAGRHVMMFPSVGHGRLARQTAEQSPEVSSSEEFMLQRE